MPFSALYVVDTLVALQVPTRDAHEKLPRTNMTHAFWWNRESFIQQEPG
jgi:hypothetical protein